jgi:hypothetical protein
MNFVCHSRIIDLYLYLSLPLKLIFGSRETYAARDTPRQEKKIKTAILSGC